MQAIIITFFGMMSTIFVLCTTDVGKFGKWMVAIMIINFIAALLVEFYF
ncbi:hypothetical protein Q5427_10990 [Brochothrix thermosphacta]|nr:hypothetical protein [Brochothrix thermosphacta]MDO7864814.1 hypothetical protein [Brochothrix thermosphacta]